MVLKLPPPITASARSFSLNPTVVVLKPTSLKGVPESQSGLNPTVVVLKLDGLAVARVYDCVSIQP